MSYATIDITNKNALPDIRDSVAVLTVKERALNVCNRLDPRTFACQSALSQASDLEAAHDCYRNWTGNCHDLLKGMEAAYGYNFGRLCRLGWFNDNLPMFEEMCDTMTTSRDDYLHPQCAQGPEVLGVVEGFSVSSCNTVNVILVIVIILVIIYFFYQYR